MPWWGTKLSSSVVVDSSRLPSVDGKLPSVDGKVGCSNAKKISAKKSTGRRISYR